jgi:two-component system cell cycle sensor histidine kinase/response regulator CckA
MTIDHSEFIARHHKASPAEGPGAAPSKSHGGRFFIALFLIFIVSLSLIIFESPWESSVSSMLGLIGAVGAFVASVFIYLYRINAKRADEVDLIREAMEASRGARLITDSADTALYFNKKFARLCQGLGPPGYASLLGLFANNAEATAHFHLLADQAHRGLTDTVELFSKLAESERWLAVTAQPIPGRAGFIHWRIDDVTQKHKLESAIRDEREKLIDFTDNAPVGFFSVNEHGRFVFANATFARWLGEDLQQLLSNAVLHTYLVAPPQNSEPYDLAEGGKQRQIVEVQMKGAGGKTFLASINQVVVREADGQVRTRAVVHDMTIEREMSLALKASEDRFQRFFDEAPLGIILVDSDGRITECNNAFATMLGRKFDEIKGHDFKNLITDDEAREGIVLAIGKIEEGQQLLAPLEVSLKAQKGALETQMHARKFKSGGNAVLHFIDLSEKKALEAQFVQSQKMQAIGQLAGGIAHDFNNLLTAMIGFCDLLLLRHKPGDPSFGDIMQIKQNSNRAANLVRQLLAFSRQQTLRPRVHDVGEILTEVSHLLRRLIGAGIELELVHGSGIHPVKVDEGQMEQVLINLAVNARDAMGGNGQLVIETQNFTTRKPLKLLSEEMPVGHWILIKVADTGCGIPKKNISRIFEPFFTTKSVGEGTGLGLATVYGIIRQTGGYLDVESEEGTGTTFLIYLPRATEADQEETAAAPLLEEVSDHKDLTGTERILLVEDEDAVRTFSQRALSNKGYEVITAENGDAALGVFANLENKKIDLLVTDVVMPGMDGPTLAGKLRAVSPNLKIIFMSGYTEDKLKDHMGENIFFLPKPFTLKQLAAKVKDVLGG